jgi:1,4-alpha-glucan branching enzyme
MSRSRFKLLTHISLVIEVMPVHENPELPNHKPPEYNWRYDPVQLFAIESSYGTPKDFKEFVKQCHKRGIAVIVDVVYKHMWARIWQNLKGTTRGLVAQNLNVFHLK